MPSATVFIDADNTLWDTDAVFAKAQLALLRFVEEEIGIFYPGADRLAFLRRIDQTLAKNHHAGLRYPPRLLAQGIARALRGLPPDRAARLALKAMRARLDIPGMAAAVAEEGFFAAIRDLPDLRPGVREGLAAIHAKGCPVLVISEGVRARVSLTAEAHELDRFIDRIIVAPKLPDLYRRVLRLTGMPSRAFMIGDQLDRDIVPAKAAGLQTIYFPGNFNPSWQLDEGQARPDHKVSAFDEAARIVLG
jgi:putative hydrolase of the HAD superfamily